MKQKENKAKSLVDNALNVLIESIEQGQSDVLTSYLLTMGRFHQYSISNIMLISKQFPQATKVAGFHTWKKLQRYVLKGEKGIKIIAPLIKNGDKSDSEGKDIFGFRVVNVFDISQTQGKELPELPMVTGDPTPYSDTLNDVIKHHNITLEYANTLEADGFSTGGRIVIKSGLTPAEDFSVRVHELAHELLHQQLNEKLSKKVKETEAEAVAFVVCSAIGFEVNSASADYIQLYHGDKETLLKSFERIQKISSKIMDYLMKDYIILDKLHHLM